MDESEESFKDGKFLTGKAKHYLVYIALVLGAIFLFSGGGPEHLIGWQTTPGSFFEKRHYTAKIYVLVSDNTKSVKLYRVPAEIQRENPCNTGDDSNPCSVTLAYSLLSITWPNNGASTFYSSDCYIGESHSTRCEDDSGKTYLITLTGDKAS